MGSKNLSNRELKLTVALYLKVGGKKLLQHVKETRRLPDDFTPQLFFHIPMNLIIKERGTDITLTPDEQLVYDAIAKEKGIRGVVRLTNDYEDQDNHT
jgi:hypothetical protein